MAVAVVTDAQGFDSYIIGLRECASPKALERLYPGAALRLRVRQGSGSRRLEVWTPQGEPLGWLPMEDGLALNAPPQDIGAEVTALVPARLLPRVHIRVFMLAENLIS